VDMLAEVKADWIVNAAAYTAVDLAEDESARAVAVNDTAVASLARAAAREGSRLLHLSTDFVFDGKSNRAYLPADQTNPLNVYGVSKLGGERHVLNGGGAGVVLRTSWVYAAAGRNFVLTMLNAARKTRQLRVVGDQRGCPTAAADLAANASAAAGIAANPTAGAAGIATDPITAGGAREARSPPAECSSGAAGAARACDSRRRNAAVRAGAARRVTPGARRRAGSGR